MSIVPAYIEHGNVWLKNPVIRSIYGDWFLHFNCEVPAELVMKKTTIYNGRYILNVDLYRCMLARLPAAGIHAVGHLPEHDVIVVNRCFTDSRMVELAYKLSIKVTHFHPNHFTYIEHDGVLNIDDIARPEGMYYSFK